MTISIYPKLLIAACIATSVLLPGSADAHPRKYKHSHKAKKTVTKKATQSAASTSTQSSAQIGTQANTQLTAQQATTLTLDINTATKPELTAVPGLSGEQLWMMVNFRTPFGYADAQDFASKVCSRIGINMGATDLKIGNNVYQGFQCVQASLSYQANGNTYSYALPVELTGSDIIPPAPTD
jgi:hypothetical protein